MPIIPEPLPTTAACHEDGTITLTATGHRPQHIGGFTYEARERVVAFATRQLVRHRPSLVITGMALGWDQAIAVAARDLNLPYWAAVPCPGHGDGWRAGARRLNDELLADAAGVTIVDAAAYHVRTMQNRNIWMVDRGHQVLALWNGTPSGTGHTVDYVNRVGKPLINCWDDWEKF